MQAEAAENPGWWELGARNLQKILPERRVEPPANPAGLVDGDGIVNRYRDAEMLVSARADERERHSDGCLLSIIKKGGTASKISSL